MQKWFYIQWHNDTHNKPQMQDVIMTFGWEAYGIYVALTEILHKNGGEIPLSSLKSMAWSLHISPDRLREFVEKFIQTGLMDFDNDILFSYELQAQFSKQKNAAAAANVRWGKQKMLPTDTKATLPQPQQQPQLQQQTELSDMQKQSVQVLVNKLKYTQDRAEQIARSYEYDYIMDKIKYLMDMIKKHNNIQSPHAYFEKALKENWISSSDISEKKETEEIVVPSMTDIDYSRFINEFKYITEYDFPQERREELKEIIKQGDIDVNLVLSCINSNSCEEDFWQEINCERKDVLTGSVFFDRQKAEKIIEYSNRHSIFANCSIKDIIDVIGGN